MTLGRRFAPPLRRRSIRWVAGLLVAGSALVWLRCGPLPPGLVEEERRPSTVVVDRRGETLYESRSGLGLRSEVLDASTLPPFLVDATIAAEDVRFRWHPGVDLVAIARAALADLRQGAVVEGGSTITQQVAKLLIARQAGKPASGWRAKLREAVVAIRLEHRFSKREIIAYYLNLAPYGNQIQGAGRASTAYFGRPASTLTAAEAAFLAALPQQPSRFDPWRAPDRARPRQTRILATMARHGWLSATDAGAAQAERIELKRRTSAVIAPHFVERVLSALGAARPRRVQTTLDAELQRTVSGIIAAERRSLDEHHAANVAVAVLDNGTGEWLAWEGSGDYFDATHGGTIDGVVRPRQPGSALKPFTYAAAFERGVDPGHLLADVPSQFPTAEPGVLYSPRNYDGRFRGPLLARAALAGSENVPAVALTSEIGVPAVARLLRRAGITTLDNNAAHYGLGLTLGNAEVRLDELVAAYSMFARGGERFPTTMIQHADGATTTPVATERVLSERTAFWITDILSDDEARAYVFGRGGSLDFPFPVAAKTGTSQSYFDNWVVGYTNEVTVGVWVGNFDRTPLTGSSGVTGAGPIFHAVMLAAVERVAGSLPIDRTTPIVARPADLGRVELCATSGMPATDACPTRVAEWLPADPSRASCSWHHSTDRGLITVWPDVFRTWARDAGATRPFAVDDVALASVTATRASDAASPGRQARSALTILQPLGGAVFLLDSTLRAEFQRLELRAGGAAPGVVDWFVDGAAVGSAERDAAVWWPLARGRHTVAVRDSVGASATSRIDVR